MTKQYMAAAERIINEGEMIFNERTGKNCLTLINIDMEYHVHKDEFPLCTTRKSFWKAAVAEMLGYIRGYDNAEDFRKLGARTWDANANLNEAWLNNPHRKGEDDMGLVYGAVGNAWPMLDKDEDGVLYVSHFSDQFEKVYNNLRKGIDDRREIWTFFNPGMFHMGCLRPCMHTHQFSLVNDKLYLNSIQASADWLLGTNFNMVQVYFLLAVMAQITGKKAMTAFHKSVNCHMYEDQIDIYLKEHQGREPLAAPTFQINPEIKTLEDLRTWVTVDDFFVGNYEHHDPIKYPFSV